MDFLLRKYGVIFNEFDSIEWGRANSAEVNTFKISNITPYLMSKMSIIVLLYSEKSLYVQTYSFVVWLTDTFLCTLLWRILYSP